MWRFFLRVLAFALFALFVWAILAGIGWLIAFALPIFLIGLALLIAWTIFVVRVHAKSGAGEL